MLKIIEEVLLKEKDNIPEVVERYGDYWYHLAKAVAKRLRKEGYVKKSKLVEFIKKHSVVANGTKGMTRGK